MSYNGHIKACVQLLQMPYKKVVKLKCVYNYSSSVEKQLRYTNPVNADLCKELVLVLQWLRWFAHSVLLHLQSRMPSTF